MNHLKIVIQVSLDPFQRLTESSSLDLLTSSAYIHIHNILVEYKSS